MTLRDLAIRAIAIAWLVALVACADGGASSERGDPVSDMPVTDVRVTPHPGWVEVTWRHRGAATYEIFREANTGSGVEENGFHRVGSVDGAVDADVHVYRDVDVEADARYRYAVAVEGGEPVPAEGVAVGPEPGHVLRIEFATAVPIGAEFAVVSDPAGIDCEVAGGANCIASFASIADVTLTARARGASWSWEGCDDAVGGGCTIAMTSDRTVTVSLELANMLDVGVEPSGAGAVTSVNDLAPNPSVACASECSYAYPPDLVIGLAAEPSDAEHYRFVGWGGACGGDDCTVTMDGDRRVEAQFALYPPEIGSFTASPQSVEPNESTTLTWDVSGGGDVGSGELSIAIEPHVGELFARSGSVDVTPSSDTTYTLSVRNASGSVQRSRTVSVDERGPPPEIGYFTVDDDEIEEGDKTRLHWSVTGPGSVTVTIEPGIGSVPDRGHLKVSPERDTTYRLTARNQHGEATAEVEVEVEDDDDDDDDDGVEVGASRAR